MKITIVLAMHGSPPNDFPENEMKEFFKLRTQSETADAAGLEKRYSDLSAKMRGWQRSEQNDPYYAGSHELAAHLRLETGLEVIVGFNEFCAPDIADAIEQAIAKGAEKVIVITPMTTRGGEHSGVDIPATIRRAQASHPEIPIIYAWPFETTDVAKLLASQIAKLM